MPHSGLREYEPPKGMRVTVRVDEPGFSDARMLLKMPHGGQPAIELRGGDEFQFILKPWLVNQMVLEALPREGDPEKPDGY
jgi:hypothetical protein